MSDDYTDVLDDDEEVDEGPVLKKLRKQIEETNKRARELEAQNATLQRESAFRTAGIDPNDPKARYFVKGYEGELDPEAIKAEAAEAGILSPEPEKSNPDVAAHEQGAQITAGADAPATLDANAQYLAELDAAGLDKEAIKAVMRKHGSPLVDEID